MSKALIDAVESAVSSVVQEFERDASVMVQFAAGEWAKIKEELAKAKAVLTLDPPAVVEPVPPVVPIDTIEPVISQTETPPGFGN